MSNSRISGLEPQAHSVARILYRYLSYRFSKSKSPNFVYTKDYKTMCREWFGGIKPLEAASQIKRSHLAPRLDPLKDLKIISSYKVEKNSNRNVPGFNVIIKPGRAFFEDYKAFYNPQMTLPLAVKGTKDEPFDIERENDLPDSFYVGDEESDSSQALALLQHFSRLWFNNSDSENATFTDSELRFAHEILSGSNLFEAKAFVDFGIAEAKSTKFDMTSFNGLKVYRKKWAAEAKRAADRMEREAERREVERQEDLQKQYENYISNEIKRLRSALSENELTVLEQKATAQEDLKIPGVSSSLAQRVVDARVNIQLRETNALPSFEEWSEQRT